MSPWLRAQLAANADRLDPYAWMHAAQANGEKTAAELGLSRGDARCEPVWSRAPTNGENIAAELFLHTRRHDILWVSEAKAVIDPKTFESLMKLVETTSLVEATSPESLIDLGGHSVGNLASGLGPGTMPAAHLADILLAVRHSKDVWWAATIHRDLATQIIRWHFGRKVTFGELAKAAEGVDNLYDVRTHDALRRLAVKVGNKNDVDVNTMIDVNTLGAETGPETMSLLTLVILLVAIPGFDICSPYLANLFSGNSSFWGIKIIPMSGICFGLARK
jgi:hypothetical protein